MLAAMENPNKLKIALPEQLAHSAFPDTVIDARKLRVERQEIFQYVASYLAQSVLHLPYGRSLLGKEGILPVTTSWRL